MEKTQGSTTVFFSNGFLTWPLPEQGLVNGGIIFFISGKLKGPGASSEMLDAEQPFYSVRFITLELGAGYSF
jgi:hypothetical protein